MMPARCNSDTERFESKTTRDPVTGCLLWTAARLESGYGVFSIRHKTVRANRWALEQKLGRKLLPGMVACHTCDNPPCVDPDHLFEGTNAENSADCVTKGRQAWGERITNSSVLTRDDVHAIRAAVRSAESQRSIARRFSINQSTVSRIANSLRWKNLEEVSRACP